MQLCLHRRNGEDHPDWTYERDPEDRKFAELITHKLSARRTLSDDKAFFRFDIKKAAEELEKSAIKNKARFMQLLSIMQNSSDTYLYIHR